MIFFYTWPISEINAINFFNLNKYERIEKMFPSSVSGIISKTSISVYVSLARISVLAFLILILAGTFLLSLPVSSIGKSIAYVDAFWLPHHSLLSDAKKYTIGVIIDDGLLRV